MDMAFWEGSHRKYTLWASVIVGCLVGFLFSGISIYSSYNQHENMAFLVRHPVEVSEALYTFSRNMAKTGNIHGSVFAIIMKNPMFSGSEN